MAVDSRFYALSEPRSLSEIAQATSARLKGDGEVLVSSVGAASSARQGEIAYYEGGKPPAAGDISSQAAAVFVQEKHAESLPQGVAALIVDLPRHAHTQAARLLLSFRGWNAAEQSSHPTNVHASADIGQGVVIGAGAAIGERTEIGPNSVIGPGVQIGRDCRIGANVTLQCALIGNNVRIYSGARVGESGFGVMTGPEGAEDAPQYGRVILQDHVTVGANSCIDRGAFDDTIIGEHTKIDNLCQIAHNVVTGRSVLMASFAGISGSVTIGDGTMLGGRVGIADHVKIGEGAQIAASAGVFREIPSGETWGGTPAKPIRQWMKEVAWLQKQTSGGKKTN